MRRLLLILLSIVAFAMPTGAQSQRDYAPMSPTVRRLCREIKQQRRNNAAASPEQKGRSVCALVKISDGGRASLQQNGARIIDSIGDILIADIPLRSLPEVVAARGIRRVEAESGRHLLLDTMAIVTNAQPIYDAEELPQAYRGDGVVMGIMDVGFDLTHPNFYDEDLKASRIRSFWDQIASQQEGDTLYVGREFTTAADIIQQQHSTDIALIHHGTHTLGIAAGAGAGTPYVGMAPEADLCLVNNAVTDDTIYIADDDLYKYTFATDVLGFKYIFDYATRQSKPCVISFSEGSSMDFHGYDVLFDEALSALVGPGRILVASAGNAGNYLSYLPKPEGTASVGALLLSYNKSIPLTMTTRDDVTVRFTTHGNTPVQVEVPISSVTTAEDSTLTVELKSSTYTYAITFEAYPSCYDADQTAVDITIESETNIAVREGLSIELVGADAEAALFALDGGMGVSSTDERYDDATTGYSMNSPASLPSVISVGATSWRTKWTAENGDIHYQPYGTGGERGSYSSLGPTLDGRVKPDVMAPGTNIISSGSTFYMQGENYDDDYTVGTTDFCGRAYPWVVMSGTSMSSPAVGGIVALWLQACPSLSPTDVMSIIQQTSTRIGTATEHSDNACGYGSINAYAGLLMALGLNDIEELPQRHLQGVSITAENKNSLRINIAEPSDRDITVAIYSVSGQKITQQRLAAGTVQATIYLPHIATGVYAISLRSADPKLTGSTLICL